MFSKMRSSAAVATVMISSLTSESEAQVIVPPQFTYKSALSCSQCINAGYEYVYDDGTEAVTQYYKDITAGNTYTGYCCTEINGVKDCNDTAMWETWKAAVDQPQYANFQTQFAAYNTAMGMDKTLEIVREFYDAMPGKTTQQLKDWFLSKTAAITIAHKTSDYKITNAALTTPVTDAVFDAVVAEADDYDSTYGNLFSRIFLNKIVDIYSEYDSDPNVDISARLTVVQQQIDQWQGLASYSDVDTIQNSADASANGKTKLEAAKECFLFLYGDSYYRGLVSDDTTFATQEDDTKTQITNNGEANVDNVWKNLKDAVNTAAGSTVINSIESRFGHVNLKNVFPEEPVSKVGAAIISALDNQPGTKKSSAAFTNLDMAIAACPNLQSKCGASRKIVSSDTAATTSIANLSANDSCHYLVVATCDLPEIKIVSNTMGASWNLDFIEWQESTGTTMQTSAAGNVDYPAMDTVPRWYSGYEMETGTLPFLKNSIVKKDFPVSGTDTTFKYNFPLSKLVEDIAAYDAIVAQYSTDVSTYNTAKKTYDAQVAANKASYETAEEEYLARTAFTCIFGCDPFTFDEITLKPPTMPTRPEAYTGLSLSDLTSDWGLGTMIAGKLDMTANKIKAFGILGQTTTTGQGYSMVPDVTVDTTTTCKKKSVMLNLYPDLGHTDSGTPSNAFSFEVKNGAYRTHDTTADPLVTAPTAPNEPIAQEKFDLLNGIGATYLSAATAALSLTAMTLF